jgi:hypothetical protein
VTDAESGIAKAQAAIATYVSALQAHAAAHQAEVTAAQALIAKAVPAATASADQAAAIVLTASSDADSLTVFLGKYWRWAVGLVAVGILAYAYHHGVL